MNPVRGFCSSNRRLARCHICHTNLPANAYQALISPAIPCLIQADWFGDGVHHPPEDYPAPEPFTSHGVLVVRLDTDEELHRCGTWVRP